MTSGSSGPIHETSVPEGGHSRPAAPLKRRASSTLRSLLHLMSVALVLPVLALAAAFTALGRAIAAGSPLKLLDQVVNDAAWLIPWGALAICAALILITLGGLFMRTRWLAGLCVAILGIGSTAIVLVLTANNSEPSLADVPCHVPGVIASAIGAWLAFTERPGHAISYAA